MNKIIGSENTVKVGDELYYRYRERGTSGTKEGFAKVVSVGRKYFTVERLGYRVERVEIAKMKNGSPSDWGVRFYRSKEERQQKELRQKRIKEIKEFDYNNLSNERIEHIHTLVFD